MNYQVLYLADLEPFLELRMEFLLSYQDVSQTGDFRKMTKKHLRKYVETEDLLLLATEEEGDLVAVCKVCFYKTCPIVDTLSGKYGELYNVYTKPVNCRKGISQRLVRIAIEKPKNVA